MSAHSKFYKYSVSLLCSQYVWPKEQLCSGHFPTHTLFFFSILSLLIDLLGKLTLNKAFEAIHVILCNKVCFCKEDAEGKN